jgi:hypothetical protein
MLCPASSITSKLRSYDEVVEYYWSGQVISSRPRAVVESLVALIQATRTRDVIVLVKSSGISQPPRQCHGPGEARRIFRQYLATPARYQPCPSPLKPRSPVSCVSFPSSDPKPSMLLCLRSRLCPPTRRLHIATTPRPFLGNVHRLHSMEITIYQPRILVEYCDLMTSISTVSQGFLFCCIFKISQPVS